MGKTASRDIVETWSVLLLPTRRCGEALKLNSNSILTVHAIIITSQRFHVMNNLVSAWSCKSTSIDFQLMIGKELYNSYNHTVL